MNLKRGLTPHLWEGAPIRFCGISIYNLIVLVVFIALLGGILGAVYGPGILKLAKEPDVFLEFIAGLGPWGGALVFVGIQVLQIIVPPIPGELVQIAAGYIFGPLLGTVYLLLGALLAQQWPFILPVFFGLSVYPCFGLDRKTGALAGFDAGAPPPGSSRFYSFSYSRLSQGPAHLFGGLNGIGSGPVFASFACGPISCPFCLGNNGQQSKGWGGLCSSCYLGRFSGRFGFG